MAKKTRTTPIPIDFRKNSWDKKVKRLAKRGIGYKAIAEVTGLTYGQAGGRGRKAGISIRDYQNGLSPEAIKVIEGTNRAINKLEGLNKSLNAMRRLIQKELAKKW
jgi:hypothetical protein